MQLSVEKLSLTVNQYQQWFALASKEIEQIRKELENLETELHCSEITLQLKNELTNVKNKVFLDTFLFDFILYFEWGVGSVTRRLSQKYHSVFF